MRTNPSRSGISQTLRRSCNEIVTECLGKVQPLQVILQGNMPSFPTLIRQWPRGIRLLTLLGFFHFSGLNNGFTYQAVQSLQSRTQPSIGIVRTFTTGIRHGLRAGLRRSTWMGMLASSSLIVQNSSQRAAQDLFQRSAMIHIWFQQNLMETLQRASDTYQSLEYSKRAENFENLEQKLQFGADDSCADRFERQIKGYLSGAIIEKQKTWTAGRKWQALHRSDGMWEHHPFQWNAPKCNQTLPIAPILAGPLRHLCLGPPKRIFKFLVHYSSDSDDAIGAIGFAVLSNDTSNNLEFQNRGFFIS